MRGEKKTNKLRRPHAWFHSLENTHEDTAVPRGIRAFSPRWRKKRRTDSWTDGTRRERERGGEGKADLTKCQAGKNSQRCCPRHDAKFTRQ